VKCPNCKQTAYRVWSENGSIYCDKCAKTKIDTRPSLEAQIAERFEITEKGGVFLKLQPPEAFKTKARL
jgi:uncharacterized Zn finger protein (UPF0148 family)